MQLSLALMLLSCSELYIKCTWVLCRCCSLGLSFIIWTFARTVVLAYFNDLIRKTLSVITALYLCWTKISCLTLKSAKSASHTLGLPPLVKYIV